MKVLIADDSGVSRTILTRMLSAWGYEVTAVGTGTEAWEILSGPDAPPIAILDWVMPGIDGIEVCRRLRAQERGSHVFVYLLTARDSAEDMLAGLDAGADDYLTKPVSAPELRIRLRNGRRLVELHAELVRAQDALRSQAMLDPLTQTYNRRAFVELAGKELSRSRRSRRPLGLVAIDLDHFKRVNDTYGHASGDAVLVETAARLESVLRDGDHLARIGGEELVVLLPECSAGDAYVVAERLRRELGRAPIDTPGGPVSITASFGCAVANGDEEIESLLARADAALYEAKRGGRNRTVLAAPKLAQTG